MHLGIHLLGGVELALLGSLDELAIWRRPPDDVADARGELVIAGPMVVLVLDVVDEARRLQHRLDDVADGLVEISPGAGDSGRDAAEGIDFVAFERAAQHPLAHAFDLRAHRRVGEAAVVGESPGKLRDVHAADDDARELRVGADVLEVDVEVVGGVAESVGAQIRWQELARIGGDIDPGRGAHRLDVLRYREPAHEVLVDLGLVRVVGRIDEIRRPLRPAIDPISQGLFVRF